MSTATIQGCLCRLRTFHTPPNPLASPWQQVALEIRPQLYDLLSFAKVAYFFSAPRAAATCRFLCGKSPFHPWLQSPASPVPGDGQAMQTFPFSSAFHLALAKVSGFTKVQARPYDTTLRCTVASKDQSLPFPAGASDSELTFRFSLPTQTRERKHYSRLPLPM